MKKEYRKKIFLDTVPVLTGYLFLGMGFGILLYQSGYGIGWSLLMSLFIYAGSGQYLAVGLLSGGVPLLTSALATLFVNARHLFYGLSLVDTYRDAGAKKPYLIFSLTDETYSLVTHQQPPEGMDRISYCFWVSVLDQCYWVIGCVLGSIAGASLPISFQGVEFVLTALFVTMFVDQWLAAKDHRPAVIGAASTALCLWLFGADIFLIPSMALMAGLLILMNRVGGGQHE